MESPGQIQHLRSVTTEVKCIASGKEKPSLDYLKSRRKVQTQTQSQRNYQEDHVMVEPLCQKSGRAKSSELVE